MKKIIPNYRNYSFNLSEKSSDIFLKNINTNKDNKDNIDFENNETNVEECIFEFDKKNNFGIKKWKDGTKFLGKFKNDKLANGWGILYNYDSEIFKGFFVGNEVNGFGEYIHKNGNINIGYWEYDLQVGIGYESIGDTCTYFGEFKSGKKNGIGIYSWIDDSCYAGEVKNNLFDGYGIYLYFDGRKYEGEWKKNMLHGYGEMTWTEGNKYFGLYKNDKRDGFGIYYSPDNKFFIGFWKNGKQNGYGKYINCNKIKYGIWKNGKFDKKYEDMDENEFIKSLINNNTNFPYFKWNINQLQLFFNIRNKC